MNEYSLPILGFFLKRMTLTTSDVRRRILAYVITTTEINQGQILSGQKALRHAM